MPAKKRMTTSDDYKKEIVRIEKEMAELRARNNDLQKKLIQHLSKQSANDFTKALYANEVSFNPKTLQIVSEKFVELQKEHDKLKAGYINSLRKELIQDFIIENPEFKTQLKDISIENTPTGTHAKVVLK
jgi:hypothetical protein